MPELAHKIPTGAAFTCGLRGNRPPRIGPELRYVLALIVLALCAAVSAGEVTQERQRALVHLLRHDCGSCHGMTLRGGLGPPLTPAALEGKSRRELEATILFGRPGTPMPPWRGMLSEIDARWLVEALKSGNMQ